jgi:hypothetical protein
MAPRPTSSRHVRSSSGSSGCCPSVCWRPPIPPAIGTARPTSPSTARPSCASSSPSSSRVTRRSSRRRRGSRCRRSGRRARRGDDRPRSAPVSGALSGDACHVRLWRIESSARACTAARGPSGRSWPRSRCATRSTVPGRTRSKAYFHPRQLAFACGVLALAAFLRSRTGAAMAALAAAAALHPTTALWFGIAMGVALFVAERPGAHRSERPPPCWPLRPPGRRSRARSRDGLS